MSRGGRPIHSRYADNTPVYEGEQPSRIRGPDPDAKGLHTVLRHDPQSTTERIKVVSTTKPAIRCATWTSQVLPTRVVGYVLSTSSRPTNIAGP